MSMVLNKSGARLFNFLILQAQYTMILVVLRRNSQSFLEKYGFRKMTGEGKEK
jgi:hypothetical protein